MKLKSFYPKVIFILSIVFVILFGVLASIISYFAKQKINQVVSEMQIARITPIFEILNQPLPNDSTTTFAQKTIDRLILEMQLDIYDENGKWLAGNQKFSKTRKPLKQENFQLRKSFSGFSAVYQNPNALSPYKHIKLSWKSRKSPVMSELIFLVALSGIAVLLTAILVGWGMSGYLSRRLVLLQNGVQRVAHGDFSESLRIKGNDEIADLGKNFSFMTQQIRDLIQRLEESNAARQRLIAHASHEIKSPLTSIKGFVDIIQFLNVLPKEQQMELLPVVQKDIQRAIKISDDLVQLARLQAPDYQMEIAEHSVILLIQEEHLFFEKKASNQKKTAILNSPEDPKAFVKIDPLRFSQIVDNIWHNALKYGDSRTAIITDVQLFTKSISIKISNRPQVPLDVPATQLLEPFYRHPQTAEHISGSGLGLAIVQELTEKMNGNITLEIENDLLVATLSFPLVTGAN